MIPKWFLVLQHDKVIQILKGLTDTLLNQWHALVMVIMDTNREYRLGQIIT